ncbi:septum formation initiator family protein [Sphingoaurantiacus capsulatus]|uniref:Septum formation initiator family protein n=1 Tax=Sphingoaurantiacus capsulatus TaxID=1771310 RepID=A0ABV7XEX9_9SPHN
MSERTGAFDLLRGAMVPTLCILVAGYFAYHAFAGRTGVFALGDYKAEQVEMAAKAEAVAERKAHLERRVALLDPRRVDPDLADELVRGNLGVVRPDEVVVKLPKAG